SQPSPLLCISHDPDHPDLPSFPTRRSSDLGRSKLECGRLTHRLLPPDRAAGEGVRLWHERSESTSAPPTPWSPCSKVANPPSSRSEEHTSELQSRFDLVCRLLLEKKKTKPI